HAHAAHLAVRAHHAVARPDALPGDALLPGGAIDVLARWIHAIAGRVADLSGRAGELAAVARGHARALVADLSRRAEIAVVRDPVAVVVEPVAFLGAGLGRL